MAAKTESTTDESNIKKTSKLKFIVPVLVLLAGLGGAGYFFVLAPQKAAAAAEAASTTTELELGKVVSLSPITMNLSDGHILKVGLALQMVAEPKEEELNALVGVTATGEGKEGGKGGEGAISSLGGLEAKALDEAIAQLGNSTFAALSAPGGRSAAKEHLAESIKELYEGDVDSVYFTTFVMS